MLKNVLRSQVLFFAFFLCGTWAVLENYGGFLEQKMRQGLYKIKGDSIPDLAPVYIDSAGIPYVNYLGENGIRPGKQYNATIVANQALQWAQMPISNQNSQKFFNCTHWLIDNLNRVDSAGLYIFNWQQPWYPSVKPPYTSGMTSGRALEVLAKAYSLSGDIRYLQICKIIVRGFYIPVQKGGFNYQEDTGWWYEELADTSGQTPRILDGHLFALQGLRTMQQLTPNDSAQMAWKKGLDALTHALPQYDKGNGEFYYDRQLKLADKKYRAIVLGLMADLQNENKTIRAYYQKWKHWDDQPFILKSIRDRNRSAILVTLLVAALGMITTYCLYKWLPKYFSKNA